MKTQMEEAWKAIKAAEAKKTWQMMWRLAVKAEQRALEARKDADAAWEAEEAAEEAVAASEVAE